MIDVKDIKEAKMKVKRLALVLLSIAAFSAYNDNRRITGHPDTQGRDTGYRKWFHEFCRRLLPDGDGEFNPSDECVYGIYGLRSPREMQAIYRTR
jgi:hypothetical protein